MEQTSRVTQTPPEAVVMQMVMGGWIARAISDVSRLNIPDILKKHGAAMSQSWSPVASR